MVHDRRTWSHTYILPMHLVYLVVHSCSLTEHSVSEETGTLATRVHVQRAKSKRDSFCDTTKQSGLETGWKIFTSNPQMN